MFGVIYSEMQIKGSISDWPFTSSRIVSTLVKYLTVSDNEFPPWFKIQNVGNCLSFTQWKSILILYLWCNFLHILTLYLNYYFENLALLSDSYLMRYCSFICLKCLAYSVQTSYFSLCWDERFYGNISHHYFIEVFLKNNPFLSKMNVFLGYCAM